jgi:hypothetical protein
VVVGHSKATELATHLQQQVVQALTCLCVNSVFWEYCSGGVASASAAGNIVDSLD